MSLFGSLQTNYLPSTVQAGRLPTVPDGTADDGVGNGGNAFLSMIEATNSSDGDVADGKLSMYATLSPELAYRASLIGSMLDDVTNGVPVVDEDPTADEPTHDLTGDAPSGSTIAYDAVDSGEVSADLLSDLFDNTLPVVDDDGDVGSPIADAGTFTNALPGMGAPPA